MIFRTSFVPIFDVATLQLGWAVIQPVKRWKYRKIPGEDHVLFVPEQTIHDPEQQRHTFHFFAVSDVPSNSLTTALLLSPGLVSTYDLSVRSIQYPC